MLKQSWACLGYLCAPITETPFAELVRLSRTSIVDECLANDCDRLGRREAARRAHVLSSGIGLTCPQNNFWRRRLPDDYEKGRIISGS